MSPIYASLGSATLFVSAIHSLRRQRLLAQPSRYAIILYDACPTSSGVIVNALL